MKTKTIKTAVCAVLGSLIVAGAAVLPHPAEAVGVCMIPARQASYGESVIPAKVVNTFQTTPIRKVGILPEVDEMDSSTESEDPELRYLGTFKITGYDTCVKCCGKADGITASGTQATVGKTCAASKDFAFGTELYIEGIGYRTVEDRGGGVNGNHIDVLCNDHPECYSITGYYEVYEVLK